MSKQYRAKSNYWLRKEIAYMKRYPELYESQITAMTNELHRRGKLTHLCK